MARRPRRAHRICGDLRCAGRPKPRRREGWRISGTLSRTSDRSPKSLVRERMSRSRLQVDLERFRLRARREGDVGYKAPRRELGRVWRLTGVVISEPGFQVGCRADVTLGRRGFAGQEVNIVQGQPSFAKASEGILLRPRPRAQSCEARRAKQD